MGVDNIPHEAILSYMDFEEIPREQQSYFYAIIETVDKEYVDYMSAKQRNAKQMQRDRSAIQSSKKFKTLGKNE